MSGSIFNSRRGRRWVATLALAGPLWGCAHDLAPPMQSPVALHLLPGAGYNLLHSRTLYLVVVTQDLRTRNYVPELSSLIASELRAISGANVIPLVDPGLDRPACSSWRDTCNIHGLPSQCEDPSAVVVFCELQELDAYAPVRVGLALHVRRLDDGLELAGVQGIWEGQPPTPPAPIPFWKRPWRRALPGNEPSWAEIVEATTSTGVMRQAARDIVQAMLTTPAPQAMPASHTTFGTTRAPSVVPPLPPADFGPGLPEIDPLSESAESVPAEPDL